MKAVAQLAWLALAALVIAAIITGQAQDPVRPTPTPMPSTAQTQKEVN